jgi:hypothetical protein
MTIVIGCLFAMIATFATIACYFASRLLAAPAHGTTPDMAASVMTRVSALHGLILALVFAQEMFEYQQLRFEATIEANAVADIYFDANRYGEEAAAAIQPNLRKYVQIVVGEEWTLLGETGRLAPAAWDAWDTVYGQVLDLAPDTPRHESLREHMLQQVHLLTETRIKRQNHGSSSIDILFWFAAISGIAVIAFAYHPFPPVRANLVLLGSFGAFTGVVLFMIHAFGNPYASPGRLEPIALERFLAALAD